MLASRTRGPGSFARRKATYRKDRWWLQPLAVFGGLSLFGLYGTAVALWPEYYYAHPYTSPFYAPCLASSCADPTWAIFGDLPSWFSPALFILPFPLLFRLTCYYYRKAYYRAFWLSPPACAVAEPHKKYSGETRFPLVAQNLHRYAFYLALPFPIFFVIDIVKATQFEDGFGIGLGTLVLALNAVLLSLYVFSCHSCRHLCGGHVNNFSRTPLRYKLWKLSTRLNARHMLYAWISLVGVVLADVYVRLVAMGVISDVRFI